MGLVAVRLRRMPFSRKQYLVDMQKWGFHDARLEKRVHMDSEDIAQWTKAIPKEEKIPGEQSL
jgi:hypothetical protein